MSTQDNIPISKRAVFDARAFRVTLAANRITGRKFAAEADLDPCTVSGALTGLRPPGELARIKIAATLKRLGLPSCEIKKK